MDFREKGERGQQTEVDLGIDLLVRNLARLKRNTTREAT
jgi:hypothetical protein